MVATKREFIFFTVVLSGLATSMLITSFATTSWLTGTLRSNPIHGLDSSGLLSTISYGLFQGTLVRVINVNTELQLSLHIACLTENNACVWSCQPTSEARQAEAAQLWNTGCVDETDMIKGCTQFQGNVTRNTTVDGNCERRDLRFMNAGLWGTTIVFLSLSLLMAAVCVAFSIYNAAFNPIQTYLGVRGLYIWNSGAVLLNLVTLVLWGVQFGSVLVSNVVYTEVITGGFSNESVTLGFSYWCCSLVCWVCRPPPDWTTPTCRPQEPPSPEAPQAPSLPPGQAAGRRDHQGHRAPPPVRRYPSSVTRTSTTATAATCSATRRLTASPSRRAAS